MHLLLYTKKKHKLLKTIIDETSIREPLSVLCSYVTQNLMKTAQVNKTTNIRGAETVDINYKKL